MSIHDPADEPPGVVVVEQLRRVSQGWQAEAVREQAGPPLAVLAPTSTAGPMKGFRELCKLLGWSPSDFDEIWVYKHNRRRHRVLKKPEVTFVCFSGNQVLCNWKDVYDGPIPGDASEDVGGEVAKPDVAAPGVRATLKGFDVSGFWDNNEHARQEYVGKPVSDEEIAAVEATLGYKLPVSYIELIKGQNGGAPKNTCYPMSEATSWAEDHVAITGIYGIDPDKECSLCGELGSRFWMEEWGYPNIGIYVCDCPSAGHDMICLDYRKCGSDGEPEVVHIDQESEYEITFVAKNFAEFVRGLKKAEEFD